MLKIEKMFWFELAPVPQADLVELNTYVEPNVSPLGVSDLPWIIKLAVDRYNKACS